MSSSAAGAGSGSGTPMPSESDAGSSDHSSWPPQQAIALLHNDDDGSAGIDDDDAAFGDPRVALFLADHIHSTPPPQRLCHLLAAAWDVDALTTLKLVCNLCGKRRRAGVSASRSR